MCVLFIQQYLWLNMILIQYYPLQIKGCWQKWLFFAKHNALGGTSSVRLSPPHQIFHSGSLTREYLTKVRKKEREAKKIYDL